MRGGRQLTTTATANQVAGKPRPLSGETRKIIDLWSRRSAERQEGRRSAIVQAPVAAQDQNRVWVSNELMDAVAVYLDVPPVWVYEVATFYGAIETEPVGRHSVSICTNISCMLCGADEVVAYAEKKLGIRMGETTPDGRIFLKREEECLAACVGAPMMLVDGHYHENLTPEKIDKILDELE